MSGLMRAQARERFCKNASFFVGHPRRIAAARCGADCPATIPIENALTFPFATTGRLLSPIRILAGGA
jgi:hypothetical protein